MRRWRILFIRCRFVLIESCHTRSNLKALKGRYEMVNIKLDKTGV
nr:L-alanine-DL-glutamate epimerase [uncultured bacterium]